MSCSRTQLSDSASREPRTSQSSALPTEPLCLVLEHNLVTLLAESLELASLVLYQLSQIKAHQFYNDLDLYQKCCVLQKIEEFKDFSRHLSDFLVLFKAYLIFKDFSRKPFEFKYFSSLCAP